MAGFQAIRGVGAALLAGILAAAGGLEPTYAAETLSDAVKEGYDKGFHDCARAADRVLKYVYDEKTEYEHQTSWAGDRTNDSSLAIIASRPVQGGANETTTFSAIKTREGRCDVTFTEVLPAPDSCLKVRETDFKDWKYDGDLAGSALLSNPTDDTFTLVLVNVPSGECLIISHMLAYGLEP